MSFALRLLSFLLLLAPIPAWAEAAKDQSLALASVTARGSASEDDAAEMSDGIASQIVNDGKLRLVERDELQRVMKEQALSQSGVMSDEVQIKVAQLVGARWIAVGSVKSSGRGTSLSLRAVDSSTAQVAFAETLKVGGDDQIEAGARQLARKLQAKLLGPGRGPDAAASNEVLGDFDATAVRDAAKDLARSLAMRFPKIVGRVVNALPNDTAGCSFGNERPFPGQFFEISGKDEVTEQDTSKGFFLLKSYTSQGCSGKVKRQQGASVTDGDQLTAMPIKINLASLDAGAGAQPELAKLLADETRAALDAVPNFRVANDPQLTAMGRVSGGRGRRTVEVQVVDKSGNVVAKVEQPGAF